MRPDPETTNDDDDEETETTNDDEDENDDEETDEDDEPRPRKRKAPPPTRWGTFALVALVLLVGAYAAKAATQPTPTKCDSSKTIPGDVCDEPGHTCESLNAKGNCFWHLECKASALPGFRGEWSWAYERGAWCREDGTRPPPPPTYDVTTQAQADQRCPSGWGFAARDEVAIFVPCARETAPNKNGITGCIGDYRKVTSADLYQAEQAGARELTPTELFALGQTVRIQCTY